MIEVVIKMPGSIPPVTVSLAESPKIGDDVEVVPVNGTTKTWTVIKRHWAVNASHPQTTKLELVVE